MFFIKTITINDYALLISILSSLSQLTSQPMLSAQELARSPNILLMPSRSSILSQVPLPSYWVSVAASSETPAPSSSTRTPVSRVDTRHAVSESLSSMFWIHSILDLVWASTCVKHFLINTRVNCSAVKRSIGCTIGFHNHGEGPY